MRALFAELSLEAILADRAKIFVVAQKTATNADIIAIDRFCLGKVATVVSLVTKLDPAEYASDPRLLAKTLKYLLDDVTGKVKKGKRCVD